MKELEELREVMLALTDLYGTVGNNQKRNLWNAFKKLKAAITVTYCCKSDSEQLPCNKCENGLIWSKDRLKAKSCDCGK